MGYALGVDLGTTFTAAAVRTNGHAEIAQLGTRRAEIPSLVFLRPDGAVLIGEAAERRGATEPGRLAREFKRRVGDPVPFLVGGAPYPAHALMARLLGEVLERVQRQQEGPPSAVTVTHPANWGPYKRELLEHAVQLAELDHVRLRSEPEAAAVQYASTERVLVDEIVAVYDLGGGTFDAAVLRKTATGFELLGEPAGIEQLGGVDFDEAILAHVTATLADLTAGLDPDDPAVMEGLVRLRRDCVEAKEALSYDTEVLVPVALPNLHTRVRLNRSEFEAMIAPALAETVAALRRTLRSARVTPDQVRSILLAGGSSRIPLVSQMLSVEFGRPMVIDTHPEHSIALGAALTTRSEDPTAAHRVPGLPVETTPPTGEPQWNRATAEMQGRAKPQEPPTVPLSPPPAAGTPPPPAGVPAAEVGPAPVGPRRRRTRTALVAGAAAVAVLLAGGVAWALWRGGSDPGPSGPGPAPAALGAWARVADLPVALEGAAVAAFQSKLWVASGLGNDENRTKLTNVFVYDPAADRWAEGPELPRGVSHAALVAAPTGLYFLGGWIDEGGSDQVLRLNGDNTAWEEQPPLPASRVAGAGAFDGTGIVYAGGTAKGGKAASEVWALRRDAWTKIGDLGVARQKLAAVGNGVDTVWLLGGRDQETGAKFGVIDRIAQGRLSARGGAAPIDPPIDSAAAVRLDGIGICLIGGEMPGPTRRRFNDWWCEQPDVAYRLPKLYPQRAGLGAARIGRTVYVVGGYGTTFEGTKRVEAYTPPA